MTMIETDDESIKSFQRMSEGIYVIAWCRTSIMLEIYYMPAVAALGKD